MSDFETRDLSSFYDINFGAEYWSFNENDFLIIFNERDRILRLRVSDFGIAQNPLMFDRWIDKQNNKTWYVREWSRNDYEEYMIHVVDWEPVNLLIQEPNVEIRDDGSYSESFTDGDEIQAFFVPGSSQEIEVQGKIQTLQTFKIDILYNPNYEFVYNRRFSFQGMPYYIVEIKNPEQKNRRLEFMCILPSGVDAVAGGMPPGQLCTSDVCNDSNVPGQNASDALNYLLDNVGGDVVGPSSSDVGAIAIFSSTDGKQISNGPSIDRIYQSVSIEKIDFDFNSSSVQTFINLENNDSVLGSEVQIDSLFDGDIQISIGIPSDDELIFSKDDLLSSENGLYEVKKNTFINSAQPINLYINNISSTQGTGKALIYFNKK